VVPPLGARPREQRLGLERRAGELHGRARPRQPRGRAPRGEGAAPAAPLRGPGDRGGRARAGPRPGPPGPRRGSCAVPRLSPRGAGAAQRLARARRLCPDAPARHGNGHDPAPPHPRPDAARPAVRRGAWAPLRLEHPRRRRGSGGGGGRAHRPAGPRGHGRCGSEPQPRGRGGGAPPRPAPPGRLHGPEGLGKRRSRERAAGRAPPRRGLPRGRHPAWAGGGLVPPPAALRVRDAARVRPDAGDGSGRDRRRRPAGRLVAEETTGGRRGSGRRRARGWRRHGADLRGARAVPDPRGPRGWRGLAHALALRSPDPAHVARVRRPLHPAGGRAAVGGRGRRRRDGLAHAGEHPRSGPRRAARGPRPPAVAGDRALGLRPRARLWPGRVGARSLVRGARPGGSRRRGSGVRSGRGALPVRPHVGPLRAGRGGRARGGRLPAGGSPRGADRDRAPPPEGLGQGAALPEARHERALDDEQPLPRPALHEAVRLVAPGPPARRAPGPAHQLRPRQHRGSPGPGPGPRADRRRRHLPDDPRDEPARRPGRRAGPACGPALPRPRRGRSLPPAGGHRHVRRHHRRAPAPARGRHRQPLHARVLPPRATEARPRRGRHALAPREPARGARVVGDRARLLPRLRGLQPLVRGGLRLDARRHERGRPPSPRGGVRPALARRGRRAPQPRGRDAGGSGRALHRRRGDSRRLDGRSAAARGRPPRPSPPLGAARVRPGRLPRAPGGLRLRRAVPRERSRAPALAPGAAGALSGLVRVEGDARPRLRRPHAARGDRRPVGRTRAVAAADAAPAPDGQRAAARGDRAGPARGGRAPPGARLPPRGGGARRAGPRRRGALLRGGGPGQRWLPLPPPPAGRRPWPGRTGGGGPRPRGVARPGGPSSPRPSLAGLADRASPERSWRLAARASRLDGFPPRAPGRGLATRRRR